jgi:hypothetical protein
VALSYVWGGSTVVAGCQKQSFKMHQS